jgi:hypothetical protein
MIELTSGDFIKHQAFKDVCIKVDKMFFIDNGSILIKGKYWCMGFYGSWPLISCKIKLNTFRDWYVKIDKNNDELRRAVWTSISK